MNVQLTTGLLGVEENDTLDRLVSYGSRINKKRGFLFVSKVLGKHLPVAPSVMKQTYKELAELIPKSDEYTLFIGFAETATALGQGVFDAYAHINSIYIHSTRFKTSQPVFFSFMEEHCHAPSHIFYEPKNPLMKDFLKKATRVILIDDEVSTGNTANNLVEQMKNVMPNVKEYFLLTLLNWSQNKYDNFNYLSLYTGEFSFKADQKVLSETISVVSEPSTPINLDSIIPDGFGRYGATLNASYLLSGAPKIKELQKKKVLVLGTAEFMYPPYQYAHDLENKGVDVYYQATTRSPVNVDGAISSKLSFKDNYSEGIDNFLYNVTDREYDLIIICYETTRLPKNYNLKEQLEKKFNVKEIFFKKDKYGVN